MFFSGSKNLHYMSHHFLPPLTRWVGCCGLAVDKNGSVTVDIGYSGLILIWFISGDGISDVTTKTKTVAIFSQLRITSKVGFSFSNLMRCQDFAL